MTSVHPAPEYSTPPGTVMPQEFATLPGSAWMDPTNGTGDVAIQGSRPPNGGTSAVISMAQPGGNVGYGVVPVHQGQDPHLMNRIDKGRWNAGLCDCCNNCVPNLCMTWCCPCVALAQIYARLALGRYLYVLARLAILSIASFILMVAVPHSSPEFSYGYDAYGNIVIYQTSPTDPAPIVAGVAGAFIHFVSAFHVLYARHRVRQRFQIPGNGCSDCLASYCCTCCAIAQMATHVKSYQPGSCSFEAPDVLPAFT